MRLWQSISSLLLTSCGTCLLIMRMFIAFFSLYQGDMGGARLFLLRIKHVGNGGIFHDHVIAAAVLDRILYHCTTINIKWESYRLKERKMHGLNSCKVNIISEESGETEGNIKYGWRILDRR